MEAILDWLREHKALSTAVGISSLVAFLGSLVAVPFLIARIPADYFATREPPPSRLAERHPLVRASWRITRNVLGVLLILLGVALLLLPGQGLLTILLGMLLVEGPGKRRLELFVVRQRGIRRAIDWIRRRAGRQPLQVWEPDRDEG